MCSTPAARARASWWVRNGTPAAGTIGLGVFTVSGRSRVPLPPTRRIASVTCRLCFLLGPVELPFGRPVYADCAVRPGVSGPGDWPRWTGRCRACRRGGAPGTRSRSRPGAPRSTFSRDASCPWGTGCHRPTSDIVLPLRIHPEEAELPGREPGDGVDRGGRRLRGAEGAEDRDCPCCSC